MIDRTPSAASRPRPHRAAHGGRASETELAHVVHRARSVTNGLALLEGAPLECAAVLLGVPPPAIERARAALADAAARDGAGRHADAAPGLPAAPRGPALPAPRDAEALLAAAEARSGGLALLLGASPECAAIGYGVHPGLVHAARDLALRRGFSQDLPDQE
jgi:hypothetical protein